MYNNRRNPTDPIDATVVLDKTRELAAYHPELGHIQYRTNRRNPSDPIDATVLVNTQEIAAYHLTRRI